MSYLSQEGFEKLVNYIHNELDNTVKKNEQIELPNNLVYTNDLNIYAKKSEIPAAQDLSGYAKLNDLASYALVTSLNDYATKSQLNDYATTAALNTVAAKLNGVYHFKGSVNNLEELQAIQNPEEGDVYNIRNTGMNAAWDGERWDDFGSIVDLNGYVREEDVQAIALSELNRILYSGKSAIVSDYDAVNAMIANNEPEVEVTLNKSLILDKAISVPAGKDVTIDLGGNSITGNVQTLVNVAGGNVTLKNGNITGANRTAVVTGGELILDGANIVSTSDCAVSATGANSSVVVNNGKITAQEAGVLVTSGAALEINGGEIEGIDNGPIMGNGTSGQGNINVVMNNGTLIAHIQSAGYTACGVYMPNSGSFTMNGGEIISDGAGIVMRGGQVNLNGGKITANGAAGAVGKVGDSRIVVGSYAIVYDVDSKYPASDTLELNIANDMILEGTDGDVSVLPAGTTGNITDNRTNN